MAETYYSLTDIVKLCDNLVAAMPTSFYSGIWKVRNTLYRIPAADVVPVQHGRWENGHCTRCGEDVASRLDIWTNIQRFLYCPFCGALMDKDGD